MATWDMERGHSVASPVRSIGTSVGLAIVAALGACNAWTDLQQQRSMTRLAIAVEKLAEHTELNTKRAEALRWDVSDLQKSMGLAYQKIHAYEEAIGNHMEHHDKWREDQKAAEIQQHLDREEGAMPPKLNHPELEVLRHATVDEGFN